MIMLIHFPSSSGHQWAKKNRCNTMSGRWFQTLWKIWTSVGMMTFPTEWKNKSPVPVTTNLMLYPMFRQRQWDGAIPMCWATRRVLAFGPHLQSCIAQCSVVQQAMIVCCIAKAWLWMTCGWCIGKMIWLVVYLYPSEKYESIGMMIPNGKLKMFQTTNQLCTRNAREYAEYYVSEKS